MATEKETAIAAAIEERPEADALPPEAPAPEPTADSIAEPVTAEPVNAPEVTTAEEWARRKEMLPKFKPVAAPFARKGVAQRKELNPLFEKYAQAKAHFSWPTNKELTEAEFDAAIAKATTNIYR